MKRRLDSLLKNEFISGSLIFTLISTFGSFLNYIFNFLTGRALGPSGYAEIISFNSYLTLTALPVTIISTSLIQKISSSGEERVKSAAMLEEFFTRKLKRWWFVTILLLLATPFIQGFTNLSFISSYLLVPTLIVSLLASFYSSSLQGLRMFFMVAMISLAATLVKLSGAVITSYIGGGYPIVILGIALSIVISFIAYFFAFKKPISSISKKSKERYERRILEIILRPWFITTALSIVAMNLFSSFDILFAKKFFFANEAGIYGSWNLFAKIILYAVGPIVGVSFVFFSSREKNQEKILYILLALMTIVGIGGYIAYTYFGDIIIFLLFGKKFIAVQPYLTYASMFGALFAIITFFNTYFLAKRSYLVLILPIGIFFYLITFFLVPKTISSIIYINIFFSAIVVAIYLMALVKLRSRPKMNKG